MVVGVRRGGCRLLCRRGRRGGLGGGGGRGGSSVCGGSVGAVSMMRWFGFDRWGGEEKGTVLCLLEDVGLFLCADEVGDVVEEVR